MGTGQEEVSLLVVFRMTWSACGQSDASLSTSTPETRAARGLVGDMRPPTYPLIHSLSMCCASHTTLTMNEMQTVLGLKERRQALSKY